MPKMPITPQDALPNNTIIFYFGKWKTPPGGPIIFPI